MIGALHSAALGQQICSGFGLMAGVHVSESVWQVLVHGSKQWVARIKACVPFQVDG